MTTPVPHPRPEGRAPPGLFVRTAGTGVPVVLLRGLGASSRYWDAVAPIDAPFRAVVPDLFGFGRSPKPSDASYDIGCHVTHLARFITPGSVPVSLDPDTQGNRHLPIRRSELIRQIILDATTARSEPDLEPDS